MISKTFDVEDVYKIIRKHFFGSTATESWQLKHLSQKFISNGYNSLFSFLFLSKLFANG